MGAIADSFASPVEAVTPEKSRAAAEAAVAEKARAAAEAAVAEKTRAAAEAAEAEKARAAAEAAEAEKARAAAEAAEAEKARAAAEAAEAEKARAAAEAAEAEKARAAAEAAKAEKARAAAEAAEAEKARAAAEAAGAEKARAAAMAEKARAAAEAAEAEKARAAETAVVLASSCTEPLVSITVAIDQQPCAPMVFALFSQDCPRTAENFRALCTGERGADPRLLGRIPLHYKGSRLHRLVKGCLVQGGDITSGDGRGGASIYGVAFEDEIPRHPSGASAAGALLRPHNACGLLSMANSGPNTNRSQFFITFAPMPALDGKHTVFGRLVSGWESLAKIAALQTKAEADGTAVSIPLGGLKPIGAEVPSVPIAIVDCGDVTSPVDIARYSAEAAASPPPIRFADLLKFAPKRAPSASSDASVAVLIKHVTAFYSAHFPVIVACASASGGDASVSVDALVARAEKFIAKHGASGKIWGSLADKYGPDAVEPFVDSWNDETGTQPSASAASSVPATSPIPVQVPAAFAQTVPFQQFPPVASSLSVVAASPFGTASIAATAFDSASSIFRAGAKPVPVFGASSGFGGFVASAAAVAPHGTSITSVKQAAAAAWGANPAGSASFAALAAASPAPTSEASLANTTTESAAFPAPTKLPVGGAVPAPPGYVGASCVQISATPIGLQLVAHTAGGVIVSAVTAGRSAAAAGVQPGWRLVAIGDSDVSAMGLPQVQGLLAGAVAAGVSPKSPLSLFFLTDGPESGVSSLVATTTTTATVALPSKCASPTISAISLPLPAMSNSPKESPSVPVRNLGSSGITFAALAQPSGDSSIGSVSAKPAPFTFGAGKVQLPTPSGAAAPLANPFSGARGLIFGAKTVPVTSAPGGNPFSSVQLVPARPASTQVNHIVPGIKQNSSAMLASAMTAAPARTSRTRIVDLHSVPLGLQLCAADGNSTVVSGVVAGKSASSAGVCAGWKIVTVGATDTTTAGLLQVQGLLAAAVRAGVSDASPLRLEFAIPTSASQPACGAISDSPGALSSPAASPDVTTLTRAFEIRRAPLGLQLSASDGNSTIVSAVIAGKSAAAVGICSGWKLVQVGVTDTTSTGLLQVQGLLAAAVKAGVTDSTPLRLEFAVLSSAGNITFNDRPAPPLVPLISPVSAAAVTPFGLASASVAPNVSAAPIAGSIPSHDTTSENRCVTLTSAPLGLQLSVSDGNSTVVSGVVAGKSAASAGVCVGWKLVCVDATDTAAVGLLRVQGLLAAKVTAGVTVASPLRLQFVWQRTRESTRVIFDQSLPEASSRVQPLSALGPGNDPRTRTLITSAPEISRALHQNVVSFGASQVSLVSLRIDSPLKTIGATLAPLTLTEQRQRLDGCLRVSAVAPSADADVARISVGSLLVAVKQPSFNFGRLTPLLSLMTASDAVPTRCPCTTGEAAISLVARMRGQIGDNGDKPLTLVFAVLVSPGDLSSAPISINLGSQAELTASVTTAAPPPPDSAPPPVGFSAALLSGGAGSWVCAGCRTRNRVPRARCAACDVENAGWVHLQQSSAPVAAATKAPPPAPAFVFGFAPPPTSGLPQVGSGSATTVSPAAVGWPVAATAAATLVVGTSSAPAAAWPPVAASTVPAFVWPNAVAAAAWPPAAAATPVPAAVSAPSVSNNPFAGKPNPFAGMPNPFAKSAATPLADSGAMPTAPSTPATPVSVRAASQTLVSPVAAIDAAANPLVAVFGVAGSGGSVVFGANAKCVARVQAAPFVTVTLMQKPLGLQMVAHSSGGVVVATVAAGKPADAAGVRAGWRLKRILDTDVSTAGLPQVQGLLAEATANTEHPLTLAFDSVSTAMPSYSDVTSFGVVSVSKSATSSGVFSVGPVAVESLALVPVTSPHEAVSPPPLNSPASMTPAATTLNRTVELRSAPLGLQLSASDDNGVIVSSVVSGKSASSAGVCSGWKLVSVGSTDTTSVGLLQVQGLLAAAVKAGIADASPLLLEFAVPISADNRTFNSLSFPPSEPPTVPVTAAALQPYSSGIFSTSLLSGAAGSWVCSGCRTRNSVSRARCVACEVANPSCVSTSSSATLSLAVSAGNSFGFAPESVPSSPLLAPNVSAAPAAAPVTVLDSASQTHRVTLTSVPLGLQLTASDYNSTVVSGVVAGKSAASAGVCAGWMLVKVGATDTTAAGLLRVQGLLAAAAKAGVTESTPLRLEFSVLPPSRAALSATAEASDAVGPAAQPLLFVPSNASAPPPVPATSVAPAAEALSVSTVAQAAPGSVTLFGTAAKQTDGVSAMPAEVLSAPSVQVAVSPLATANVGLSSAPFVAVKPSPSSVSSLFPFGAAQPSGAAQPVTPGRSSSSAFPQAAPLASPPHQTPATLFGSAAASTSVFGAGPIATQPFAFGTAAAKAQPQAFVFGAGPAKAMPFVFGSGPAKALPFGSVAPAAAAAASPFAALARPDAPSASLFGAAAQTRGGGLS